MGNPLTSENAAFRWLVVVLVAAVSVGVVAKLFGPTPGILYGMVLLTIVSVIIAKGMVHLLGNPENDPPEEGDGPSARLPDPAADSRTPAGPDGPPPAATDPDGQPSAPADPPA